FYVWKPGNWSTKKLSDRAYPSGQFRQEIWRSNISGLLFGIAGAFLLWCWQQGHTRIYLNRSDHPWWWIPVSFLLALAAQETYYYWFHRWMHIPAVFRVVHKWHHDSRIASPWTAFSFHPIEGMIQAAFLPLLVLLLPLHLYVLLLLLVVMSVTSVINHLDIEIYPAWFSRSFFFRTLIGATHHALHHKQYKYNFGLYFTWWDKWQRTESPSYDELIRKKSGPEN
ncbi:MAG: hypothetical protein RJA57_643, partial [Bacteroidota bacterium]